MHDVYRPMQVAHLKASVDVPGAFSSLSIKSAGASLMLSLSRSSTSTTPNSTPSPRVWPSWRRCFGNRDKRSCVCLVSLIRFVPS